MLNISARNQLPGVVSAVEKGAVNGLVTIDLDSDIVTADITNASIDRLGIEPGREVLAVIKASSVMFATGEQSLSARNQFCGTVSSVEPGAVNGIVTLVTDGGLEITGSITMSSIERLGLAGGVHATAIIKATEVMVAVEE